MKHLLILIILFLATADSFEQQPMRWTRLNGPNVGGARPFIGANGEIFVPGSPFFSNTNAVYPYYPDGYGYSVSKDNGKTWDFIPVIKQQLTEPSSSGLVVSQNGVYFYYMISNSSKDDSVTGLYRSTDQGISWEHVFASGGYIIKGTTNNLLIYNSNEDTYVTMDDGKSWVLVTQNYYGSVIGANDKYIFFFNFNNKLTRYSIADRTFTDCLTFVITDFYHSFPTMIASDLLVAYSFPYLIKSDGIQPWDTIKQFSNVLSIARGNGDAIIITGVNNSGYVYALISNDRGITWDSIPTSIIYPSSGLFVNCTNPDKFIYDDGNAIYTSTDKGSSWLEIGVPYESVTQLVVSGTSQIFVNSAQRYFGGVLRSQASTSSDNGNSWKRNDYQNIQITRIGHGPNESIVAIGTVSPTDQYNSVWLFDSTASLYWKRKSTVQKIGVDAIVASDSKYIYVSSGENIFQSTDNALTWTALSIPNTGNSIFSLDASSDGTIYFGSAPAMYRSDNNGTTWIKLHPVNDPIKLTYIKTFGSTGVLLGTEGDGLLLSNDKGITWTRIDEKNFDTVICIGFNSKGEIAAGTNRGLWLSDASKLNWSKVILGHDENLYIGGIDVALNDDFYVGTYGSSVWKGTRNYNGIKYSPSTNSAMQISPNPTNGKITITLNASREEQIRLGLYDILGRRIAVLADGRYFGENQVSFNTSELSNGIYTLILSGTQNETQKIVVQH